MEYLVGHALISPDELKARLSRSELAETDIDSRLISAINAATGWMDDALQRRLASTVHRTAETKSCTPANNDDDRLQIDCTTASTLLVGDDVSSEVVSADDEGAPAPAIEPGTRVASVSGVTVALTRQHRLSDATAITFGNAALPCRPAGLRRTPPSDSYVSWFGDGSNVIRSPETPLRSVLKVEEFDYATGSWVSLSLTGMQFDSDTGRIEMASSFSSRSARVRLSCVAGYEMPTMTRAGHPAAAKLREICFRAAEVFFEDALSMRGRSQEVRVGDASTSIPGFGMPEDIVNALRSFSRVG